jgi:hypothetical protein
VPLSEEGFVEIGFPVRMNGLRAWIGFVGGRIGIFERMLLGVLVGIGGGGGG